MKNSIINTVKTIRAMHMNLNISYGDAGYLWFISNRTAEVARKNNPNARAVYFAKDVQFDPESRRGKLISEKHERIRGVISHRDHLLDKDIEEVFSGTVVRLNSAKKTAELIKRDRYRSYMEVVVPYSMLNLA